MFSFRVGWSFLECLLLKSTLFVIRVNSDAVFGENGSPKRINTQLYSPFSTLIRALEEIWNFYDRNMHNEV
jgi:hypothetical protein